MYICLLFPLPFVITSFELTHSPSCQAHVFRVMESLGGADPARFFTFPCPAGHCREGEITLQRSSAVTRVLPGSSNGSSPRNPRSFLPHHNSKRCFLQTRLRCSQLVTDALLSKGSTAALLGVSLHGRQRCLGDIRGPCRVEQLKANPGSTTNYNMGSHPACLCLSSPTEHTL